MKAAARTFASLRAAKPSPSALVDEARVDAAFLSVFTSAEGQIVLGFLRELTVEQCLGPDASDSALRMHEGKRQLVALIERRAMDAARRAD